MDIDRVLEPLPSVSYTHLNFLFDVLTDAGLVLLQELRLKLTLAVTGRGYLRVAEARAQGLAAVSYTHLVLGSFVRAPTLIGSPRAFVNDGAWHDLTIASVNLLADRCVVRFSGLEDLMTIGDTYLITGMKGMSCEP